MRIICFLIFFVFAACLLPAQEKTYSGIVINSEDKNPLAGVEVKVKGKAQIVFTGPDGVYHIKATEGDVILFRRHGMQIREIITGTSNTVDVEMDQDYAGREEFVNTGYTQQQRRKITGSVTQVAGEDIRANQSISFDLTLQDKVPGAFVASANGKSASPVRFLIRGISSVNARTGPLFVVDGIPLSAETPVFSGAPINPLVSLNNNDIASVEVLKDAASLAVYGARGANGVVLITTRRGFANTDRAELTIQSGFSSASRLREFMNKEEYISFLKEAAENGDHKLEDYYGLPRNSLYFCRQELEKKLIAISGWAAHIGGTGKYLGSEVDTDWQNEAFRNGMIYSADFSAYGGTDRFKYYSGIAYNNNEGILVGNGIEKLSGRLNIDNKITKRIDIGLSVSLNRNLINQLPYDNDYAFPLQVVALAPVTPVRNIDNGELYNVPVTTYYNPLIDLENALKKVTGYRTMAVAYIYLSINSFLKWKNEAGIDLYTIKEKARYGEKTLAGTGRNGFGFVNQSQNQALTGRSYLTYSYNHGKLNLEGLLGSEFQFITAETLYAEGENYPTDAFKTLSGAKIITDAFSASERCNYISWFSGINADYANKYQLTLTGRVDGSSRFGKNNRYGLFPGVSLGWIISEENFLKGVPYLSYLKIRSGYGVTGNSGIGNYWHLGLYGKADYDDKAGIVQVQLANPDLKWESLKELNFGIDYGFLKDRITGGIDIYSRKSSGLIMKVNVPALSGFQTQIQNSGVIENKGFEFFINSVHKIWKIEWNTGFFLYHNRNKIVSLGNGEIVDNGGDRFMNVAMEGYPLGSFYGAEYAGVDFKNGDALWYVNRKDANGNIVDPDKTTNIFEQANYVILGNPNPDFTGTITNSLKYRNFELLCTFQGVAGNKIHLAGDTYMASNGFWFDNQLKSQLLRWRANGNITKVPQARLFWHNGNQSRSSRYLSDGSYLKLREIVFSYGLPTSFTKKINVRDIKIFILGRNLLTFTRYEGWDPEVSADFIMNNIYSGIDFYSAPQQRSVVMGIKLGL